MSIHEQHIDTDDIVTGVPAIRAAIQDRFRIKPTDRQVRYWISKGIVRVGRVGTLICASVRNLHEDIDKLVAGEK
jgi:hypothetical protein